MRGRIFKHMFRTIVNYFMYEFGNSKTAPLFSVICEIVNRTENLLDIIRAFNSSLLLVLTRLLFLKYRGAGKSD
jgi:hypothetical protein